ncbi:MAG: S-methyl-5'-thioadenosine phosphorylase [Acidobacteria bacterium]|nr:S-methyl-5'-thioadenosine phosphorylase [Acidobacteriota bacterium]
MAERFEDINIGVIGGSGLYDMKGLKNITEVIVETPFGMTSDNIIVGEIDGQQIAFLARHGRGHRINPSNLPNRANIYAFKKLGVKMLISVSACGSLKEEYAPGSMVIIDQFVDRTKHRNDTFFEGGIVAHVSMADPVCNDLADVLFEAGKEAGASIHKGGTYLNMEGPQFGTRAESHLYRSWGIDVVGMTNFTEARLAREAEICYATIAMVSDYDCWHESEEEVSVEMIIAVLNKNVEMGQKIIRIAAGKLEGKEPKCECQSALKYAIMTNPDVIPGDLKKKLNLLIGKYIK